MKNIILIVVTLISLTTMGQTSANVTKTLFKNNGTTAKLEMDFNGSDTLYYFYYQNLQYSSITDLSILYFEDLAEVKLFAKDLQEALAKRKVKETMYWDRTNYTISKFQSRNLPSIYMDRKYTTLKEKEYLRLIGIINDLK